MTTNLVSYSWQQARDAYARGERKFIVSARYPIRPKNVGIEPCGVFCGVDVIFEHTAGGYLLLKCEKCGKELNGGLWHVGISDTKPKSKRMFGDMQRLNILRRDGVRCFLCHAGHESEAELEIDHIVPHSLGGPTEEENGITLCRSCNQAKSATVDIDFVLRALIWANTYPSDRNENSVESGWRVMKRVAALFQMLRRGEKVA